MVYATKRKPKDGKVLPPEFEGKVRLNSKKKWVKPKKRKRKTYSQDWPVYNLYQTKEKEMFLKILNEAVNSLNIEYKYAGNGRPHYTLDDMIKCCAIKVFNNFSSRRTICELKLAYALDYIGKVPHFNSINNYMESQEITKYLHQLYKILAIPLIDIENNFAPDATGFSTFNKRKWMDIRFNRKERRDYKKLSIISGIRTNIITSAKVSDGNRHDILFFEKLVRETSSKFKIKEVYADSGYLSRKNCGIVDEVGAEPFIHPKENTTTRAGGVPAWYKMVKLWKDNQELFEQHYHQRSKVESAFSMIKRKFLHYVRSKTNTAQINEILCKVVCHNISVLVNSLFELDINLSFSD